MSVKGTIRIGKNTKGHAEVLREVGYEVAEEAGAYVITANEIVDGKFESLDAFKVGVKGAIEKKNLFSYKTSVKIDDVEYSSIPLIGVLGAKGAKSLTAFFACAPKPPKPVKAQKSLEDLIG